MTERPRKLAPLSILAIWGAHELTLAEKVVCYHDWSLDQGGADACYASHAAIAARCGGSVAPATVEHARQRLKRLGLHEPVARRDARNLGWIVTLPAQCVPRSFRDVPAMAEELDRHILAREAWRSAGAPTNPVPEHQLAQGPATTPASASSVRGVGGVSSQPLMRETQLPSAVREKGVGAHAPEGEKRGEPETEADRAMRERWEQARRRAAS